MNRQLLLLDEAITSLNAGYQSSTLRLIRSLQPQSVQLGVPALFSVLLRLLLKHKLSKRDKNEIMLFLSDCICDICSVDFLRSQSENIDNLYGRLVQDQLLYNTFKVCCRMIAIQCSQYSNVLLMFFVYHADSTEPNETTRNQMQTLAHLKPCFDPFTFDDTRWRSAVLSAEACITDFMSPFEYSLIKPNGILLYSPLLNDLSFCEHFHDSMEMMEFLGRHATSPDVLVSILTHFASSFLYVTKKNVGPATKMLQISNETAERIVDIIYSRSVLDVSVFVELNLFTEKLLRDDNYSQLVINKLIYLSRYYKSIECVTFLVDNYLNFLEPHMRMLKDLIDTFLSEHPEDCRIVLSRLIKRYDVHISSQYAKCSQAVLDYIQTFRIASETDSQQANKKLDIIKELKRLHSYVDNNRSVHNVRLLR